MIARLWPMFVENAHWAVGDGHQVRFWEDCWVQPGYRLSNEVNDIHMQMRNICVADMTTEAGDWNMEVLQQLLPADAMEKINSVLPPNDDRGHDMCVWPDTSNGNFSVAGAYRHLANFQITDRQPKWEYVWNISAPERVRTFMWTLVHGRILTNLRKLKMGIGDGMCKHCPSVEESILHVMRDCPLAREVWHHLVPHDHRASFYYGDLQFWVTSNVTAAKVKVDNFKWGDMWAVTCHFLWCWRNREKLDDNFSRPFRPWSTIYQHIRDYAQASRLVCGTAEIIKRSIEINWFVHQDYAFCLNTDGASKQGNGVAGCGGVLRDQHGRWIRGFAKYVGSCNALIAELWGVLQASRFKNGKGVEVCCTGTTNRCTGDCKPS